jgi:hypothetical protein
VNKVKRIVKVLGMVNAAPQGPSKVINGFSDTMVEVFGEREACEQRSEWVPYSNIAVKSR